MEFLWDILKASYMINQDEDDNHVSPVFMSG